MDFGALPPEINSGRMYAGAGAGPMMAAAAAWNNLAAELSTTAAAYESAITELTGEQWMGPASASAAAAVQPFVAWLNTTAAHAQRAASQAMASAAAFETAFAMMIPPPVIAANRALLAALMATNFLGINTPAIMATEAHYAEMWAQDAAAMYSYAASSAAAGILDPLTSPTTTANPAGLATTGTQAGLTQVISGLPNAVAGLASPAAAADPSGLLNMPFVANAINGGVNTTAWWVMNTIPNAVLLNHAVVTGAAPALAEAGAANSVAGLVSSPGSAGLAGTRMLAGLGQASTVGRLSVPASWSAAAPSVGSGASALGGSGWAVAPEEAAQGALVPAGVPSAAMAGRGYGFVAPRYGFKPTVMPKMNLA